MSKDAKQDHIWKDGPESHPSFGLISLNRVQSTDAFLFDSPFRHRHFIILRVLRADRRRAQLHMDHIHGGEELIEVAMSEVQFAHFVTSANMGQGSPCTITRVNGEMMPPCPADKTKEIFQEEVVEEFEKAAARAKTLEDTVERLMQKDRLTAEDKKALKNAAFEARRVLNDHLPFLRARFVESMDKVVQQAKTEVEAHINAVVSKAGLEGIREQLPRLEPPKGPPVP